MYSAPGSSLFCSIIASRVYCLPREGGQSPSGRMGILLYLSLRYCAYFATHSGGSGGAVSAATAGSSRTVSGIPGMMVLIFQPVSMQLNEVYITVLSYTNIQAQNSLPLSAQIFSAMFLFPVVTKALANFLYDALVSILSQVPNIFTLHM